MEEKQILVVEDTVFYARLINDALQKFGYNVSAVVPTGEEAISKAKELNPDLVLMDIVLQGEIDGIEAAANIRRDVDIPVIYLTAFPDVKILERAKITEPFGFLIKPFNEKELHTSIEIALYKFKMEKKLRESEERYREILSSISEGYYETNLQGRYIFFNDSFCRITGYSREELLGAGFYLLQAPGEKVYSFFNKVYQTGVAEEGFTFLMRKKDGGKMVVELSISPVRDSEGTCKGFRGLIRDITERKRYEEKLQFLSFHDALTSVYNRGYFEEEMLRLTNSREYPISIIVVDLDGLKIVNDSLGHEKGDLLLRTTAEILNNSVRANDIISRIGGDEFALILPRTGEETAITIGRRISKNIELYREKNPEIPLNLSLGISTSGDPSHPIVEIFKEADNNMYRNKISRSSSSRRTIVKALLSTLAERDFITGGHAERLRILAHDLGELLGLSPRQISDLNLLSSVHDLGKVGIPDRILFKPGRLDENEWVEMRRHPEIGHRIASASPDLQHIADLILYHHERWDGSGYPGGLRGKEIPVECRILALVDAYDAMTSTRPYRKGISPEQAIQEIRHCSGTQFEPQLAKAFIEMMSKRIRIKKHIDQ